MVGNLLYVLIVLMVIGMIFGSPVVRGPGANWGPSGGLFGIVILLVILRIFGII